MINGKPRPGGAKGADRPRAAEFWCAWTRRLGPRAFGATAAVRATETRRVRTPSARTCGLEGDRGFGFARRVMNKDGLDAAAVQSTSPEGSSWAYPAPDDHNEALLELPASALPFGARKRHHAENAGNIKPDPGRARHGPTNPSRHLRTRTGLLIPTSLQRGGVPSRIRDGPQTLPSTTGKARSQALE